MLYGLYILVAASALFWTVVAFRIHRLARKLQTLDAATPTQPAAVTPLISVIVPARNEERDLAAGLRSLAAQDYPALEIVVIDDESTDRTFDVARATLAHHPRAKILRGRARPNREWVGKSWAAHQGASCAGGEWLLLVDADIVYDPAAVRQAFNLCAARQLAAVSILPRIECVSVWDKLSMPLFALLSVLVHAPDSNNSRRSSSARLAGAFILISRAAYSACGGHHAVRREIIEDIALARNLKQAGLPTHLTYTSDLAVTRMYASLGELWQGLSRLTFPTLDFSLPRLAAACGVSLLSTVVPFAPLVALAFLPFSWAGAGGAAAGLAVWLAQPWITRRAYQLVGVPLSYALLLPVAANLLCAAAIASAWRHCTGRGIVWKARSCQTKATAGALDSPKPGLLPVERTASAASSTDG